MTTTDISAYSPFDAEVMADPLSFYGALRDHSPVHYLPEFDAFAISRFQDVYDVLENGDGTFVASEGTLPPADLLRTHNAGPVPDPSMDPMPIHAKFGSPLYEQVRQAYGRPLRPGSVAKLEDFIRTLTDERIDVFEQTGAFDLTQDYGGIVAASVVCHLVGLPLERAADVLRAVNAGSLSQPGVGVVTASARPDFLGFLVPLVEERRRAGADGSNPLIDGLIAFRLDEAHGGRPLTDSEIATQLLGVFIGGTETVPKVVAHGLWEIERHPDQKRAILASIEENVTVARDEIVRYCAPAQWFVRTVRRPVTVSGTEIAPGQRVICLIGSANRDEREYPEPDEFRWDRRIDRSVTFGRGQHFCIGYHVARLEIRVLLERWLARVPDFHIDEGRAVRLPSSFQWGWNSIPVSTGREV